MTRGRWAEDEFPTHFPSPGKARNAPSLAMTAAALGPGGLPHFGQGSPGCRRSLMRSQRRKNLGSGHPVATRNLDDPALDRVRQPEIADQPRKGLALGMIAALDVNGLADKSTASAIPACPRRQARNC